jgi:hypothetical protein
MKRLQAFAVVLAVLASVVAIAAAACASKAESPTPSEEPRTSVAVTPTIGATPPAACPTAPPASPATQHATATAAATGLPVLTAVTASAAECGDQLTFTFRDGIPSYDVRYEQSWTECGSGEPVTTQGPAQLIVQFRGANAHDDAGNPTAPKSLTPALPSVKELRLSCDFEADVAYAVGTEERSFAVTVLQNPARVVVEVAH